MATVHSIEPPQIYMNGFNHWSWSGGFHTVRQWGGVEGVMVGWGGGWGVWFYHLHPPPHLYQNLAKQKSSFLVTTGGERKKAHFFPHNNHASKIPETP